MRLREIMMGVVAGLLALPLAVPAQTVQQRLDALEQKVQEQGKSIGTALGVDIHALVSGIYTYSINNPDDDFIQYRVFDTDHGSITLEQASLFFGRNREDENLGFTINVDFGKVAEVVGSVTCWNSGCDSSEQTNSFELRDAYLTYKLPLPLQEGYSISLKAGKFITLLGYEVLKTWDSFNYNISNSIMFGYAIAFTHTGLLANIGLTDKFGIDIGVVNGWDAVVDNNDGKTLLAGISIAPVEMFSTYIAGTYGAEQDDNGKSKRGMVTMANTLTLNEMLTFALDLNWATESDLLPRRDAPTGLRSANWYGVAGYVVVNPTERLSLILRAEVFDDPDGVRAGFQAPNFAPGVTVWEITPTIAYQVTDGLLARFEYRHDEADKPFFQKGDRFQNGSDTIAFQLLYAL
jgi:hypothetical protein